MDTILTINRKTTVRTKQMDKLILPDREIDQLPPLVVATLSNMPREAQQEFLLEYQSQARNLPMAYVLHFLFLFVPGLSLSYGYLGKWLTQILFWLTLGGGGVWWFVNIFRMPHLVRRHNRNLADRILHRLTLRHGRRRDSQVGEGSRRKSIKAHDRGEFSFGKAGEAFQPRPVEIEYDPAQLNLCNLKTGYMFDYDQQSWNVVSEAQFDWGSGLTEKAYKVVLSGESGRSARLVWRNEAGQLLAFFMERLNIHAVNDGLEEEIVEKGKPFNVLTYKDSTYYREPPKEGVFYENVDLKPQGVRLRAWEYVNESRTYLLRIEQTGPHDFRVFGGRIASSYEFTDILPPL